MVRRMLSVFFFNLLLEGRKYRKHGTGYRSKVVTAHNPIKDADTNPGIAGPGVVVSQME